MPAIGFIASGFVDIGHRYQQAGDSADKFDSTQAIPRFASRTVLCFAGKIGQEPLVPEIHRANRLLNPFINIIILIG